MSNKPEQPDRQNILPEDFPEINNIQDYYALTPEQQAQLDEIGNHYPFNDPEALQAIFDKINNRAADEEWYRKYGKIGQEEETW